MKSIVPYTKEIQFSSKIAEICSISLEHEIHVHPEEIEGNFIVSGEYKSHEISVNKEAFLYKLPFSVDVTDHIDTNTIDFEITDFTYEILNENTLKVDIEFSVSAEEIKEVEEKLEEREAFLEDITTLLEEKETVEEENETLEEEKIEDVLEEPTIVNDPEEAIDETRVDKESEELILDSASEKEDEFASYHIHIVNSGDTIESIALLYQTDISTLKEYNNIESMAIGDKIIIPCLDE